MVTLFQACDDDDKLTIDDVLLIRDTVKLTYPDTVNNRTINYSVVVVSTGNASGKVQGTEGANVSVAVNGIVTTVTTDASGIAAFTGLKAGDIGVVVSAPDHSTANLTVNLHLTRDPNEYDAEGQRYATTTVALFPTAGPGTATLRGRTQHNYNVHNGLTRGAKEGTKIIASVVSSQSALFDYVSHTGDGSILDVVYQGITTSGTVDASGNYELVVPASGEGVNVTIIPDAFIGDFVSTNISTGDPMTTQEVWRPDFGFGNSSTSIMFISGSTQYRDITWVR